MSQATPSSAGMFNYWYKLSFMLFMDQLKFLRKHNLIHMRSISWTKGETDGGHQTSQTQAGDQDGQHVAIAGLAGCGLWRRTFISVGTIKVLVAGWTGILKIPAHFFVFVQLRHIGLRSESSKVY